jgi:uncharacterized protein
MKIQKKLKFLLIFIILYLFLLLIAYNFLNRQSFKLSKQPQNKITYNKFKSIQESYVKINDLIFNIEIADTPEKQIKGLSNHKALPDNKAMLFVFSKKQIQNFWMKDMNFPLDIIWIDDIKIIKIDKNLPPEGSVPKNIYSSISPVNYVLEINAGLSDKYNLKVGDDVQTKYKNTKI